MLKQYPNDVNKMNEVLLVAKAFDAHNDEEDELLSTSLKGTFAIKGQYLRS